VAGSNLPDVDVGLTDADRGLLEFVAEHRLVLERQLARLTGLPTTRLRDRLSALAASRYLSSGQVFGETHFQIRQLGLAAIGSRLKPPQLKLATYKHDVGAAWLWLAARGGTFGSQREVIGERRLRSDDGAFDHPREPYGVRLGGSDRYGNERLHYPDLLLIDPHGRRLALELELSSKGRERRERILGGYAADRRVDRVLYLIEANPAGRGIRRSIESAAREAGLTDRIRFQLIKELRIGSPEPAREPLRTRSAGPVRRAVRQAARRPARRPEATR
jgi:hypothetical protein